MKRSRSRNGITSLASKAAKMGNEQHLPHTIQRPSRVGVVDHSHWALLHKATGCSIGGQDLVELKHDSTEENPTHSDQTSLLVGGKGKYEGQTAVPLFLQKRTNPNFKCKECLQILLKYNADENLNGFLKFLLISAARDGHMECLKILLFDRNVSMELCVIPLLAACRNGHLGSMKILLDYNANQNMNKLLKFLLFTAASNGYAECLQVLLDYNVDLNAKSLGLLLLAASENGHAACVKVLLDYHADPNLHIDKFLEEPFLCAVDSGRAECVKLLLDYTADANLNMNKLSKIPLNIVQNTKHHTKHVKLSRGHKIDLNFKKDRLQETPLIAAVKNGYAECKKILLDYNGHPNLKLAPINSNQPNLKQDQLQDTPLIAAVKNDHVECVKILLNYNADLNWSTHKFLEILLIAVAKKGHIECVKVLLDHSAYLNLKRDEILGTLLISAAENGRTECVIFLLDYGTDPNWSANEFPETPLIAAAVKNHIECVKILLHRHANPNFKMDKFHMSPLIAAAESGHTECVKILLACNADPNLGWDDFKVTPLIAAVLNGNAGCVKILLDYNADPNLGGDEFLGTPFIVAAENGHTECLKLILDHGTDPNWSANKFPETPLMAAAMKGRTECVKILLDHHADPNLKMDKFHVTPLLVAIQNDHTECVKILLDYHADPDLFMDQFPVTPLTVAVEHGHAECVKLLLDYNADPHVCVHAPYFNGKVQALHLAVFYDNSTCMKLLLDKINPLFLMQASTCTDVCPLQVAIIYGKYEGLKTLLSCDFPVNSLHHRDMDLLGGLQYFQNFSIPPISNYETAFSLAACVGDIAFMKILMEYGANVNSVCFNIDGELNYSFPPIFSALLSEEGNLEFLVEHGCDISFHREDVPSNECLLFSFFNYDFTLNLLKLGSDPHLLFRKGNAHSQQCFVDCLTVDVERFYQDDILNILELLLLFTAITGPVQSSFHAVSTKCQEIFKAEYNDQRWSEILRKVYKPPSLKNLCRVKIRQLMISKHGYFSFRMAICKLCFPQMLKKYLLYSELEDVQSS